MIRQLLRRLGFDPSWGDWAAMPADHELYTAIERQRVEYAPYGVVLDLGCGVGHVLSHLRPPVPYLGIDIQAPALKIARKKCGPCQSVVRCDLSDAPRLLNSLRFNVIICAEVLYYQPSVEAALALLEQYRAALTPDGVFIVSIWVDRAPRLNAHIWDAVREKYSSGQLARQTIPGPNGSRWEMLVVRPSSQPSG